MNTRPQSSVIAMMVNEEGYTLDRRFLCGAEEIVVLKRNGLRGRVITDIVIPSGQSFPISEFHGYIP